MFVYYLNNPLLSTTASFDNLTDSSLEDLKNEKKKFQIAILADSRFILCSIQMELSVNIIYDKNPTAMGGNAVGYFYEKF